MLQPARVARSAQRVNVRPGLIVLIGLVCVGVVAAGATAISHSGSTRPLLRGASFTTRYPTGWMLRVRRPIRGVTTYSLGSTSSGLNELGIPAPGEIGITVSEYSTRTLAAYGGADAGDENSYALLEHVIGIPHFAESATVLDPPHATNLAGVSAAGVTYSYTYNGVGNVQSDIVARHGSMIVSIEMDAEPSLLPQANLALDKLKGQWRWKKRPQIASYVSRSPSPPASRPRASAIVGYYDVVGNILASYGIAGEKASDLLFRHWRIRRVCTSSGCRLILTRDLAAESRVSPISAVLLPASRGWTAHFVETQGCPGPDSPTRSSEWSSWKLWVTQNGLEAIEYGHSPRYGACAPSGSKIHWYATKIRKRGK